MSFAPATHPKQGYLLSQAVPREGPVQQVSLVATLPSNPAVRDERHQSVFQPVFPGDANRDVLHTKGPGKLGRCCSKPCEASWQAD